VSAANVERVRAAMPGDGADLVTFFAGGGALLAGGLLADDAQVRFVAATAELTGEGPEGVFAGWVDWLEPWQSYRVYSDGFLDRDDRVAWLVRLRGVTKRGGVEMEQEAVAVFRFEGDEVVDVEFAMGRDRVPGP
jgi:hypothetical protein